MQGYKLKKEQIISAFGGNTVFNEITTPTIEYTISDFYDAVEEYIEATARSRGYSNAAILAGYVYSKIPNWKNEAEIFIAWRDSIWVSVFEILDKAKNEESILPKTPLIMINNLEKINW